MASEKHKNLVLVLAKGNDPQLAMLKGVPHVVGDTPAAFADAAKAATVIFDWGGMGELLREMFSATPNLRWVHSKTAGIEGILFPQLIESEVPLTNGSGVFSQALGEFALAAILYFAKDFRRMVRNQVAGVWEQFDVDEITGQTVGIVGYGDIGRAVAVRVSAMGMRVLALKRHVPDTADPLIDRYYKPDAIHTMLRECDYVVAAAPLTKETHHMISDSEIAVMKPNAVIINIGRGPVIDQAALVQALTEKRIKGAGLDVFEVEPIPAGDVMYKLENVLLSPHCADHTATWNDQAMQFFVEQYARFDKGEPLKNIVNKRLGY
jgi:phosphoglycerate dehydrogenase-like enzyme